MSIINSSSTYVSSLVDYILDVKPYHTKLTEVISEYQFRDDIHVKIIETPKSKTILSSEWSESFIADGYRTHWLIPDYNYPRYSIEANRHNFTLTADCLPHLIDRYGIHDAYQLRASRGVESVMLTRVENGITYFPESLMEGIDYFVSKGMYSFAVNAPGYDRYWAITSDIQARIPDFSADFTAALDSEQYYVRETKIGSLVTEIVGNSILLYNNTTDPADPLNLQVNFGKYSQDSFEITCVSEGITAEFTTPAQIWEINHDLGTTNLVWEIYIGEHDGLNWIEPLALVHATVNVISDSSLQVIFSNPVAGRFHVVPAPAGFVYTLSRDNFGTWTITHKLKTTDLVVQMYVEQNDGLYHAVLPQTVEIIDNRHVALTFTPGYNSKVILLPADEHKTVRFETPSDFWTVPIDAVLGTSPIIRCYQYNEQTGTYSEFQPQHVDLYSDRLEIFSSIPVTGYVVITTRDSEELYSVTNNSNFIGYASVQHRFHGRNISFNIISTGSHMGDKISIARQAEGITIHPAAPAETWSLIKVNPISYGNIGFESPEAMQLVAVALENYNGNEAEWTVTCSAITSTGYSFTISAALLANGQPMNLIQNQVEVPFNQLVDFDVDSIIQLTFYPKKRKVAVGDFCSFTLGYEGSKFEKQLYDFDARIPDAPDNFDFYDSLPYEGDNYAGYYYDLTPFVGDISGNKPRLKVIPLGSAYSDAVTETWTMVFVEALGYFTVTGSITGETEPAYFGKEYDNGLIRFRIITTGETFDIRKDSEEYRAAYLAGALARTELGEGDTLYFTILKDRPSYLVHGSVSGYTEPAVIGQYYWNDKIGFMLDLPKYEVSTSSKSYGYTTKGLISFNASTGINFTGVPKYDAFDERLSFELHTAAQNPKLGSPVHQYLVNSNLRGYLPAAVVNERYVDFETNISTIDRNAIVDFTIVNGAPNKFRIDVITHPFKVFHSAEVLLLPNFQSGTVVVNTFQEDEFQLFVEGSHPELGNITTYVPTYITNAELDPKLPDRGALQDVWLNNVKDQKVGVIKRELDDTSGMYRQTIVIEQAFADVYLPLNTEFLVKVRQADEYNDLLKVKFRERLTIDEQVTFSSSVLTHVEEETNWQIGVTNAEAILTTFGDANDFYDTIPYDFGFYDLSEPNITVKKNDADTNNPDNSVATSVADFGLSIIMQYGIIEAGYEEIPFDTAGYGIYPSSIDVFYQMPPLEAGPLIGVPYSQVEYETSISSATLEMPENGHYNFAVYQMAEPGVIDGPLLLNYDYTVTQLNALNAKPTYTINLVFSQPVTIIGFM